MSATTAGTIARRVAAGRWTLRPDASRAAFRVRDKLVTTVHGTLPARSGSVTVDEAGDVVSARLELAVAGVDTGNARRDRDLVLPRFLDAAGCPSVVVVVTGSQRTEAGWGLAATLHARGASAPLDLDVEVLSLTDRTARVRVRGDLDRSPLGIRVPSLVIGRVVALDADLTFAPEMQERPSAAPGTVGG